MTRTRRAYNRRPIHGGPGYRGIVVSQRGYYKDDGFWTAYHPYKQLCMGHCPCCKRMWIEHAKERRKLEKRHAEQEILNSERFN